MLTVGQRWLVEVPRLNDSAVTMFLEKIVDIVA